MAEFSGRWLVKEWVFRGLTVHCRGLRSYRRSSRVEPGQPSKIVGKIGKANFSLGADDADGADDESKPAFLGSKDVLNQRPHPRASGVAAGDVARHLPASGFLALELRLQAAVLEQGEVGG